MAWERLGEVKVEADPETSAAMLKALQDTRPDIFTPTSLALWIVKAQALLVVRHPWLAVKATVAGWQWAAKTAWEMTSEAVSDYFFPKEMNILMFAAVALYGISLMKKSA